MKAITTLILTIGVCHILVAQERMIISKNGDRTIQYSHSSFQDHYFLESADAGDTWDTVRFKVSNLEHSYSFSLDFNQPSSVVFASDDYWIIPGFDGTFSYTGAILTSKDMGRNWHYVKMPGQIKSLSRRNVHFMDPAHGFVYSSAHYATSVDSGKTWEVHNPPSGSGNHKHKVNWINHSMGTWKSDWNEFTYTYDGGFTWEKELRSIKADTLSLDDMMLALMGERDDILLDTTDWPIVLIQTVGKNKFGNKDFIAVTDPPDNLERKKLQEHVLVQFTQPGEGFVRLKYGDPRGDFNGDLLVETPVDFVGGEVHVIRIDQSGDTPEMVHLKAKSKELTRRLNLWRKIPRVPNYLF